MSLLTIMPSGKTIEAAEGQTLLELILAAGESIPHKCDGNAKCGSCHIFVQAGRKSLSKISPLENEKLDSIVGVGSKSRLACQSRITGTEDINVELLGFASGF
ncbi:2Fe-2S iron-sulfur cluster-binding protein [Candidatus Macondimonas diazotrophica]|jgi:2Fe-2S ferredoxin|uniref:2Fe-2S iron-sulfur cluster binding domain-containing protein n=1 Tax=Candidatus Macondimonas diazotrophica TaxID=2305248 RepID=A0A4Z0F9A5_9GAMM|nr:2Fe-2S iron-sulfur cluster-binding protein [Candidatus Macondimonas diazotrophica]MDY6957236.1 2Fe-2S iron-sulfur cluster-binding protein [Pseudomonadota bacterium]HBG31777.1 ferredoxin [Gammaproteobacteria bacterium]NCU01059.1 2Fe-2S iron-sulfur cluster binding domain-containing protein [Candidatus Macondimonas diazotrophica]TFZ82164.1 2Fe-2S iron-sulfur cluster binding domain-containing protein [Candidatus Macondimonas diazotrophica]HCO45026.1 ferredoxin [Gammaproteobacteria bacterium]